MKKMKLVLGEQSLEFTESEFTRLRQLINEEWDEEVNEIGIYTDNEFQAAYIGRRG